MVLRALWPPLPKLGEVVGCVDRRTGKIRWRAVVRKIEGMKIHTVRCGEEMPVTFKWWWATREHLRRARELAARRRLISR